MALYVLVFLGGTPFGAPVIGALAEALGPRSSLLIGGAVSAAAAVAAVLYLQRVMPPSSPEQLPDVQRYAAGAAAARTTG
jgi:hypothetical protein